MSKRKEVEARILDIIKDLCRDDFNVNLYKELFKSMNDKQFDEFMVKLKNKEATLSIIESNTIRTKITVSNNYKIAKKMGFSFSQRLTYQGDKNIPDFTTPNQYTVLKLPIKRAAQLLSKKISIPEDNKSIDQLSGQVTGKSKASKLTMPEIYILAGLNCKNTLVELLKTRGGDLGESYAFDNLMLRDGRVTQETLRQYSTKVVSTTTFKNFLLGMHIKSTI